jgi:hypothetical protein
LPICRDFLKSISSTTRRSRASRPYASCTAAARAVRKAVRDELRSHQLVTGQESDSADGATLVRLGG